jgi:ABC-type glutathione transport system ATPase component
MTTGLEEREKSGVLLDIEDLTVDIAGARGHVRAVDSVSAAVQAGESLGIVGESGCGKSTLLRSVPGLLPSKGVITRGHVRFKSVDLATASKAELLSVRGQEISMIFQEPMSALNPSMHVGDQIAEGPRRHFGYSRAQGKARAVELMKEVGIADPWRRASAYPH